MLRAWIIIQDQFCGLWDKERVTSNATRQIFLFFVVGAGCAFVDITALALLVEVLGLSITLSFFIAVVISTTLNYYLNVKYVFIAGKHKRHLEAFYFFVNSVLALALNYLIMWTLIDVFNVWYIFSRSIALITVSTINFILRKYVIFEK